MKLSTQTFIFVTLGLWVEPFIESIVVKAHAMYDLSIIAKILLFTGFVPFAAIIWYMGIKPLIGLFIKK